MDINRTDSSYQARLSSSNKINKDYGFKQIFDQKLSEINATNTQLPIDNKTNILEHGDKILNLLDNYTRDLIDPAKTLRDIEPLVKSIQKEVDLIETEATDKGYNDKELEGLIRNLVVTANVAAFKFHRGDYV